MGGRLIVTPSDSEGSLNSSGAQGDLKMKRELLNKLDGKRR
jgi:hypothetical protein